MRLQRVHHLEAAGVPWQRQLQLEGDRVQNLLGRDARIGQVDRLHARRQARLQHPAQHGLAAAHLAGDLDDPLAVGDRVGQRLQHRAAVAALEKEVGVRRDAKRRLLEAEEGVVHRAVESALLVSGTGA